MSCMPDMLVAMPQAPSGHLSAAMRVLSSSCNGLDRMKRHVVPATSILPSACMQVLTTVCVLMSLIAVAHSAWLQ